MNIISGFKEYLYQHTGVSTPSLFDFLFSLNLSKKFSSYKTRKNILEGRKTPFERRIENEKTENAIEKLDLKFATDNSEQRENC